MPGAGNVSLTVLEIGYTSRTRWLDGAPSIADARSVCRASRPLQRIASEERHRDSRGSGTDRAGTAAALREHLAGRYVPPATANDIATGDADAPAVIRSRCTALGFWDTGLKPTLPEHAVEGAAGDIQPG